MRFAHKLVPGQRPDTGCSCHPCHLGSWADCSSRCGTCGWKPLKLGQDPQILLSQGTSGTWARLGPSEPGPSCPITDGLESLCWPGQALPVHLQQEVRRRLAWGNLALV